MLVFRAETALPLYASLRCVRIDGRRAIGTSRVVGANRADASTTPTAGARFAFSTSDYCDAAKHTR
jgi:hypothetical protein